MFVNGLKNVQHMQGKQLMYAFINANCWHKENFQ